MVSTNRNVLPVPLHSRPHTYHPIKHLLLLLTLSVMCLQGTAQIDLFMNEQRIPATADRISCYIDGSNERVYDRYERIRDSMRPLTNNDINLSYANKMLWLRISLHDMGTDSAIHALMLRNPHVNYVNCWILEGDSMIRAYPPTGDHLPFNSRLIDNPNFVFPIPVGDRQQLSVLLLIDKRNEQLNIPIHLLTEAGLYTLNHKGDLLSGLICGICLLLFLLNLFLYIQMKERLYVFYGLYIFTALLYIISDHGLLFMYLFPDHPLMSDLSRPLAISTAAPLYLIFGIEMVKVKDHFPRLYKWVMRYLLLYLCILIGGLMMIKIATGDTRVLLVKLMQLFQNLNTLIILVLAIMSLRKKVPYAGYLIASSATLIVFVSIYNRFLSGLLIDTLLTRNLMNLGFTIEISILAFALTLRFRDHKVRSEILQQQVNEQQEQIFKVLTDHQQQEMQRLSSLLHDTVGARLSAIRLNLETATMNDRHQLEQSIQDISTLADEVRQFSHSSSPIMLQQLGLEKSIERFIDLVNANGRLHVQFESIGSQHQLPTRYEQLIYNIIQELVQNIIKHAGAKEAIVQLMLEKELVSIFIEDDGHGSDLSKIKDGLGLTQIKQLIALVKGDVRLTTAEGKGWQVSIEFPIITNERETKTDHS